MTAIKELLKAKNYKLSTALRNRWLAFGRGVGDGGACMTALSEGEPSLPRESEGKPSLPRALSEGKPSLPREGNCMTTLSEGELSLVRERV